MSYIRNLLLIGFKGVGGMYFYATEVLCFIEKTPGSLSNCKG
jgi:hypothetical protein